MSQVDALYELFQTHGNCLTLGQILDNYRLVGSKYTNRISELEERLEQKGMTIDCHECRTRPPMGSGRVRRRTLGSRTPSVRTGGGSGRKSGRGRGGPHRCHGQKAGPDIGQGRNVRMFLPAIPEMGIRHGRRAARATTASIRGSRESLESRDSVSIAVQQARPGMTGRRKRNAPTKEKGRTFCVFVGDATFDMNTRMEQEIHPSGGSFGEFLASKNKDRCC